MVWCLYSYWSMGGGKGELLRRPPPPFKKPASLERYLKTTWTDFPPPRIFPSWWGGFFFYHSAISPPGWGFSRNNFVKLGTVRISKLYIYCYTTAWWGQTDRGSQRDVVYLGWPIAPSYMSPKGGGGFEVSANECSCAHESQICLEI